MFSVVSVSLFTEMAHVTITHEELELIRQGPLRPRTVDKRAVRILLEGFLVMNHSVCVIARETDGNCSV